MPALNLQTLAIAIIAALLAGFGAGWTIDSWRLNTRIGALDTNHAQTLTAIANEAQRATAAAQQQANTEQQRLSALATRYNEELTHAQTDNAQLRATIASGTRRLYVAAQCPTGSHNMPAAASNPSATAATARAELDAAAAGQLIAITSDGDDAIRQLNALINACEKKP